MYAKSGSSWQTTSGWVTNPIRITSSARARDFTGEYSFDLTESENTLVLGAIPYTTQSLKDISAGYNFMYWAECVAQQEEVAEEETVVKPEKADDSKVEEEEEESLATTISEEA